jgi:site-specific recombinase XerC
VTHLRKMMLEEVQRRHYSEATTQRYIRLIERVAQHFHRSPDRLGPQHIREYQAQLFTVHKLTPGSVTNHLCALRFFHIQTLKRTWSIADTPYPKKRYRLPTILSQEEVAQLIDAAPTPFYRTILMTLYGTGARRAESHAPAGQRHRQPAHGGAHSGRQGSPRPRRHAQSRPARGTARSLATSAQKVCLVISRQPLAQR